MKFSRILFFISVISLLSLHAQDQKLISIYKEELKKNIPDSTRAKILVELGWEISYLNLQEGLDYCLEAKSIAESIDNKKLIAKAYNSLGTIYTDLGEYPKAIESHLKQIEINKKIKYNSGLASGYGNLSRVYGLLNNLNNSLIYSKLALNAYDNELKRLYSINGRNDSARQKSINNVLEKIALTNGNIAAVFIDLKDADSVFYYISIAIDMNTRLSNEYQLAANYFTVARVYSQLVLNYTKASDTLEQSIALFEKLRSEYHYPPAYMLMGEIKVELKNFKEAIVYFNKAIYFSRRVGFKKQIERGYKYLSELYELEGNCIKSLEYFKKYSDVRDTILMENQQSQISLVHVKMENERKNVQISVMNEKSKTEAALASRQRSIMISLAVIGLIAIAFSVFVYKQNIERRRTNQELSARKGIIEEQNKEIKDSINYAQRIQQVILPQQEEISKYLKSWFIFFQPKDVVSGDFYWFANKDDRTYIAAIDCTGHGVPGAFMSMIGYTLLNEILNDPKIILPADVLNELRKGVIKSLKQKGVQGENKDGMDIALCLFQGNKVYYAGAYNPMWLIRDKQVMEYKANKQPIGIYGEKLDHFTNHEVDLQPGDAIYIFTDGYADQFGGPNGKKFKYSKLKELLLSIYNDPIDNQKEIIAKQFIDWKGGLEQIDDVLMIGIKV